MMMPGFRLSSMSAKHPIPSPTTTHHHPHPGTPPHISQAAGFLCGRSRAVSQPRQQASKAASLPTPHPRSSLPSPSFHIPLHHKSMEPGSERPLQNPPDDGISSLAFSPSSSNLLLVSSWDKTARLYDAGSNTAKGIWRNHAAVLDCAVQDDQTGFSGGLDRAVRMYVAEIVWRVDGRHNRMGRERGTVGKHDEMNESPSPRAKHHVLLMHSPLTLRTPTTGSTWTDQRTQASTLVAMPSRSAAWSSRGN